MARHRPHYQIEDVQLQAIRTNLNDISEHVDTPDEAQEAVERTRGILREIEQSRRDVPTRADYRQAVEAMAESVVEGVREWDQELSEAVYEAIDGSQFLIYHTKAIKALEYSQNEPFEWKPFAQGDDWRGAITGMAYTVLRQDVYDELESEGYLDEHRSLTNKLTEGEA